MGVVDVNAIVLGNHLATIDDSPSHEQDLCCAFAERRH